MSEEQTVSLVDVLEEDEELEEEASAVLAGSDSDHCSYPQVSPYVKAVHTHFYTAYVIYTQYVYMLVYIPYLHTRFRYLISVNESRKH